MTVFDWRDDYNWVEVGDDAHHGVVIHYMIMGMIFAQGSISVLLLLHFFQKRR
jgi:hypothetical protein